MSGSKNLAGRITLLEKIVAEKLEAHARLLCPIIFIYKENNGTAREQFENAHPGCDPCTTVILPDNGR